jgi:hypothetical protein
MEMIDVQSSNLSQVGYDPETRTLAIVFKKGDLYHYDDVPPEVFDELMEAPSTGRYFSQHIRNSFTYTKEG